VPQPPSRPPNPTGIAVGIILATLILLFLTAVVGAAIGGCGTPPTNAATHPAAAPVTDADFTFQVTDVTTARRVRGDGGTTTAKGRYVLVHLLVTNSGRKPRFVSADDQTLRAGDKIYKLNVEATVDADKGPEIGLPEKINPGAAEEIVVVFDVPAGTTPQAIELHGSAASGGVTVALPAA
jgi:hypothetical protein